jgi:phospholipid transport system substrate-binding protein
MIQPMFRTLALILTLNLSLAAGAAWAGTPTDIVKGTVDEIIRLLNDPVLKSPAQRQSRRQLMKRVIDRHFDYEEMARRSLGTHWKNLTPAQRSEFVKLFGELLEASYSSKIERYTDEKVNYTSENLEEDYAEVRSVVLRKNDRIPMDYRLYKSDRGWMVYDVVIEGVSLVSNYRSQFGRIIGESSYGELVRRLRNKVTEVHQTDKI